MRHPVVAHDGVDRARDLVPRGQLFDEALAVGAEERCALAADRLGDEKPLTTRDAGDGRRVKLHELEVGERGPGRVGEHHPDPDRARRVGRARPQCGGAAGREDRRTGSHGQPVLADDPDAAALVVHPERCGTGALDDGDPRVLHDHAAELAHDPAPGGAPAGMHDAAAAVPALETEGQSPGAVGVEAHAVALEVGDGSRRLGDQDLGCSAADDPAARDLRVLEVDARRSRPRRALRPGRPGPSSWPSARAAWPR